MAAIPDMFRANGSDLANHLHSQITGSTVKTIATINLILSGQEMPGSLTDTEVDAADKEIRSLKDKTFKKIVSLLNPTPDLSFERFHINFSVFSNKIDLLRVPVTITLPSPIKLKDSVQDALLTMTMRDIQEIGHNFFFLCDFLHEIGDIGDPESDSFNMSVCTINLITAVENSKILTRGGLSLLYGWYFCRLAAFFDKIDFRYPEGVDESEIFRKMSEYIYPAMSPLEQVLLGLEYLFFDANWFVDHSSSIEPPDIDHESIKSKYNKEFVNMIEELIKYIKNRKVSEVLDDNKISLKEQEESFAMPSTDKAPHKPRTADRKVELLPRKKTTETNSRPRKKSTDISSLMNTVRSPSQTREDYRTEAIPTELRSKNVNGRDVKNFLNRNGLSLQTGSGTSHQKVVDKSGNVLGVVPITSGRDTLSTGVLRSLRESTGNSSSAGE